MKNFSFKLLTTCLLDIINSNEEAKTLQPHNLLEKLAQQLYEKMAKQKFCKSIKKFCGQKLYQKLLDAIEFFIVINSEHLLRFVKFPAIKTCILCIFR
jgi:hypothetical protein